MIRRSRPTFGISRLSRPVRPKGVSRLSQCVRDRRDRREVNGDRRNEKKFKHDRRNRKKISRGGQKIESRWSKN